MNLPDPVTLDEYRELASSLKRRRRAELLKPRSKRDRELIDECDKTLLYCNQRILELGGTASKTGVSIGAMRLSWAAAIALVIALIMATSVVAYASGRRALSDKVDWNIRRVLLNDEEDYLNGMGRNIPRDELDEHKFTSESELRSEYGDDLLLPGSLKAVYFVSATAYGKPGNALIRCEYRVNGKPLILEIDSFYDEELEYYEVGMFRYPDDFKAVHTYAMFVGTGTDCSFAYFSKGRNHYIMTGGQGTDIIVDIAKRMMEGVKE